jgi:UDP-glucose 4-epimerase
VKNETMDYFEDKKVLVTGGAGFIGSHLAESLVDSKSDVTILDDFSAGKWKNLEDISDNIRILNSDISNNKYMTEIKGFDIIFNEAATSLMRSFRDPLDDLMTNSGGLINILELARKYDIKIIHASTGSIYGNPKFIPFTEDHPTDPISPYGISKLSGELYCKLYSNTYGIDVCCLRYFNVYGPRQIIGEDTGVIPIFITKILRGLPISIFGDGNQTRDFLHVTDCVRANLLAAASENAKGAAINIGGRGEETSIFQLARLIMNLAGIEVPIRYKDPKPGDISRLVADISKAKELIGYHPNVSLAEGMRDLINYFTRVNSSLP